MFNLVELKILRQSLDIVTVVGKDAKSLATLQSKVEYYIEEETKKSIELNQLINPSSNQT